MTPLDRRLRDLERRHEEENAADVAAARAYLAAHLAQGLGDTPAFRRALSVGCSSDELRQLAKALEEADNEPPTPVLQ